MKRRLLPLALLLLAARPAACDDNHYINIFIGERAAGLGGAYTAIADGPEGAYYNPAGLAFSPASYFSLSTNAVQLQHLNYQNIWPTAAQRVDYVRDSFYFIPNFFGIVQKQKGTAFAFTLSTLDNEAFDQRNRIDLPITVLEVDQSEHPTTQTVNVNYNYANSLQEAGAAVGWLISPVFSIGAGIFADYQDAKRIQQDISRVAGYDYFQIYSLYLREQLLSLRPVVGMQLVLADVLTVGYAATVALPILGNYTLQTTRFYYAGPSLNDAYVFSDAIGILDNTVSGSNIALDGLFRSTQLKNSFGLAFFPSRSLLFSADFYLYVPLESPSNPSGRVLTWNAAAGMEWYINPYFPLRLGLFTNNSNTPALQSGKVNQLDHIDYYGGSLSLGYTTADFGINVGASGAFGLGKSQILAGDTASQDLTGATLQIFISGGYQY